MKARRLLAGIGLMVSLISGVTACGSPSKEAISVNTEIPVDIVDQIAREAGRVYSVLNMSEGHKKSYQVLIDGAVEDDAVYYLCDIAHDAGPELILGKDRFTVYSYNGEDVATIGALDIDRAYLSNQYGLVVYYDNNGTHELRREQYNGELFNETVLVSENNEADYENKSAVYLNDAVELNAYSVVDKTPFE